MKKFKPNKITTFMFAMIEILSPFSVGIPLMILLIGKENYTTNDKYLENDNKRSCGLGSCPKGQFCKNTVYLERGMPYSCFCFLV